MAVLFHGNFALDRPRLAGILDLALKNPTLKDKGLAHPFKYGAPFAARYRSWLHKTGLTEVGLPLELTAMGTVVMEHDPSLKSLVTQWFLHHELVTDPHRSEAWHYFALEFLPKHETFSKEQLLGGLTEKLSPHSMQHFGPGSSLNQLILRKILQVYTAKEGLGDLGLIEPQGDSFRRRELKALGPWVTPNAMSKAYAKSSVRG